MQDGVAVILLTVRALFVVSKGFMSVSPEGEVVIMVDSAVDDDISEEKPKRHQSRLGTMSDVTASERAHHGEANLSQAMWKSVGTNKKSVFNQLFPGKLSLLYQNFYLYYTSTLMTNDTKNTQVNNSKAPIELTNEGLQELKEELKE